MRPTQLPNEVKAFTEATQVMNHTTYFVNF
jgi:hypothetical protein